MDDFTFEMVSEKYGRFSIVAPVRFRDAILALGWTTYKSPCMTAGNEFYAKHDYRVSGVKKRTWLHRMIWEMAGNAPVRMVDHIDRNPLNNSLSNLRDGTYGNGKNAGVPRNSKSGVRGVTWDAKRGAWRARVVSDGVDYPLGLFASLREATVARDAAAREYHGEFAFQHQVASP